MNTEEITNEVKKFYIQDFIYFQSIYYIGKIETNNLRKRIKNFHQVFEVYFNWTLDDCFSLIKELLVSSDERLLFIYWEQPDKDSLLTIWNISTKSIEGKWCTSCNSNEIIKKRKMNLKKWISDYPECVLKSWNFNCIT